MRRKNKETYKQTVIRLLFALVLVSNLSIIGFGQTEESEEPPDVIVPEQAMEQVVRRVLVWSFKPRNKPTVIYLAEQGIKQSWLPTIKNTEFRLLSIEEIQQKNLKVHFFTKPDLSKNTYGIGFVFGDPTCEFLGENWCFRISKQKVRLRLCGGVGGGCSA
jgi:hypothetical protein